MKAKTNKNMVGKVVAVSAGVAALAAAGYFFFGPSGEKNRKKMKGWIIKMKGEIVEKLETVKEVSEPVYAGIVDAVAAKYASIVDKGELEKLVKELKKHWKSIAGVKSTAKKATSKARTMARSMKKATPKKKSK